MCEECETIKTENARLRAELAELRRPPYWATSRGFSEMKADAEALANHAAHSLRLKIEHEEQVQRDAANRNKRTARLEGMAARKGDAARARSKRRSSS